jgi:hypothetical protein
MSAPCSTRPESGHHGEHHPPKAASVNTVDLTMLNRNRVRRLAALGRSYFNPALKRFGADKRHTILVCTLQDLEQRSTDDLLEMLDVLIGRLFKTAEEEMQADQAKHGRTINSSLVILREVATVVLDPQVPDLEVRLATFSRCCWPWGSTCRSLQWPMPPTWTTIIVSTPQTGIFARSAFARASLRS